MIAEYKDFVDENPKQEVLNFHSMAAAEKTEHYEIAAYGNLIVVDDKLGLDDADLLKQNLREEQDALDELKELTEEFEIDTMLDE